jgi:hypothetical protein
MHDDKYSQISCSEIWLYFPSCIIESRDLTVFPIMHYRNTIFDCVSHHGKYSQISCVLSCLMGNTVKSRVPIIHDGKHSQIACSYNAWWETQSNLVCPTMLVLIYNSWWETQSNLFIHISSLPGKRLIRVGGNEIWLYFPSRIIGTCNLTVFPIMHYRNTRLDCISHHELYIGTGIVGHTRFDCVSHYAL